LSPYTQGIQRRIPVKTCNIDGCARELEATLLAGSVGTVEILGTQQPEMVPKIHTFFSQDKTITTYVTRDGPHLNEREESTCALDENSEDENFEIYLRCRDEIKTTRRFSPRTENIWRD